VAIINIMITDAVVNVRERNVHRPAGRGRCATQPELAPDERGDAGPPTTGGTRLGITCASRADRAPAVDEATDQRPTALGNHRS
jgi:hypothetical protein